MKFGIYHNESVPHIDDFKDGAYLAIILKVSNYVGVSIKLEDLGWELRDCVKFLSGDESLQIAILRKPFKGTVANNVLTNGCGGINIDACRITTNGEQPKGSGNGQKNTITHGDRKDLKGGSITPPEGRFPANLILECTCEKVIEGKSDGVYTNNTNSPNFTDEVYSGGWNQGEQEAPRAYKDTGAIHTDSNCPCKKLDLQSGDKSGTRIGNPNEPLKKKGNKLFGGVQQETESEGHCYRDGGGASRYFKNFETIGGLKIYLRKMIDPDYENI